MTDCLFCKIIAKEIPSDILFQDERITIFKDINPAAPIHLLVVPNQHIPSVQEMKDDDEGILGAVFLGAKQAAEELGISRRTIINKIKELHLDF